MGAYNWVLSKETCPKCNQTALLKAQTHIASSYDGDETGRFHDREYQVGEAMAWWPKTDRRYSEWKIETLRYGEERGPEYCTECCYAQCPLCQAELYVVICFKEATPIEVVDYGLENQWPSRYFR